MHGSSLLPGFRWRRHHRAAALDLNDRACRRTIHQTRGAAGVSAFFDVDLDAVLRFQSDVDRVDVDLTADDVAHPAFGAALVVDFEAGHAGLLNRSLAAAGPAAPAP